MRLHEKKDSLRSAIDKYAFPGFRVRRATEFRMIAESRNRLVGGAATHPSRLSAMKRKTDRS
jgi:hypothetical protein